MLREAQGGSEQLYPQDAIQEEYAQTGTFPGTPLVLARRPWALINWLFWACLLLCPFVYLLLSLARSGSSLTLASCVLVFFMGRCRRAQPWGEGEGAGTSASQLRVSRERHPSPPPPSPCKYFSAAGVEPGLARFLAKLVGTEHATAIFLLLPAAHPRVCMACLGT